MFWSQIRKIIQEELWSTQKDSVTADLEERHMQRKEVAIRLRIFLLSLSDWVKKGLPSHKQRGRVFFLYTEVMGYIKKNKIKRVIEIGDWWNHRFVSVEF